MIRHVVFFRFKSDASSGDRQAMIEGLGALPGRISQIRSWSQGTNVLPSDRSYDFCLIGDFDSLEDLKIYQDHPDHQDVVQNRIRPIVDSVVVVDFEG